MSQHNPKRERRWEHERKSDEREREKTQPRASAWVLKKVQQCITKKNDVPTQNSSMTNLRHQGDDHEPGVMRHYVESCQHRSTAQHSTVRPTLSTPEYFLSSNPVCCGPACFAKSRLSLRDNYVPVSSPPPIQPDVESQSRCNKVHPHKSLLFPQEDVLGRYSSPIPVYVVQHSSMLAPSLPTSSHQTAIPVDFQCCRQSHDPYPHKHCLSWVHSDQHPERYERGPDLPQGHQEQEEEARTLQKGSRQVRFHFNTDGSYSPETQSHTGYSSKEEENCSFAPLSLQAVQKKSSLKKHVHHSPSPVGYGAFSNTYAPITADTHCTGLVCDPEDGERVQVVWSWLKRSGLSRQCKLIEGKKVAFGEIQGVDRMSVLYGTNPLARLHRSALRKAVGSVIELALQVVRGELRNGFAIVNLPEVGSVSSHTKEVSPIVLVAEHLRSQMNVRKILIVDWDVHHRTMIQEVFYTDPSVLYISLHHYGDYSITRGNPNEVGSGLGEGYTVNVAWSGLNTPIGDAEYLAAFRSVVLPIGKTFQPDLVLVSSEFDAVRGHSAYEVSPACIGMLTQQLMDLAEGRVVLVLEGGHDISAICDTSEACLNALLCNKVSFLTEDILRQRPCAQAVQSLLEVLQIHSRYWTSVKDTAHTIAQDLQSGRRYSTDSDAASALASLSMTGSITSTCSTLNSEEHLSIWCFENEPMEHDEGDTAL